MALTFDDGPHEPYTSRLLDVLADYGVRATFFLVGDRVGRHPGVVRRMVREGHALGNHGYTHTSLERLSPADVWQEVSRTRAVIEATAGVRTSLFRPPYGAVPDLLEGSRGIGARLGQLIVLWSVQVDDWRESRPRPVVLRALQRVRPGAIVLLHDGGGDRTHTVTAVRWMVGHLARRGYRFVTVPELLARADAPS